MLQKLQRELVSLGIALSWATPPCKWPCQNCKQSNELDIEHWMLEQVQQNIMTEMAQVRGAIEELRMEDLEQRTCYRKLIDFASWEMEESPI
jgi:hypothetical protein